MGCGVSAFGPDAKHIFISYAWKEVDSVKQLCSLLEKKGYYVWVDWKKTGGPVPSEKILSESAVILLCLSNTYITSPSCISEAQHASKLGKPYLPLLMEKNCDLKNWMKEIKLEVTKEHVIEPFLSDSRGNTMLSYDLQRELSDIFDFMVPRDISRINPRPQRGNGEMETLIPSGDKLIDWEELRKELDKNRPAFEKRPKNNSEDNNRYNNFRLEVFRSLRKFDERLSPQEPLRKEIAEYLRGQEGLNRKRRDGYAKFIMNVLLETKPKSIDRGTNVGQNHSTKSTDSENAAAHNSNSCSFEEEDALPDKENDGDENTKEKSDSEKDQANPDPNSAEEGNDKNTDHQTLSIQDNQERETSKDTNSLEPESIDKESRGSDKVAMGSDKVAMGSNSKDNRNPENEELFDTALYLCRVYCSCSENFAEVIENCTGAIKRFCELSGHEEVKIAKPSIKILYYIARTTKRMFLGQQTDASLVLKVATSLMNSEGKDAEKLLLFARLLWVHTHVDNDEAKGRDIIRGFHMRLKYEIAGNVKENLTWDVNHALAKLALYDCYKSEIHDNKALMGILENLLDLTKTTEKTKKAIADCIWNLAFKQDIRRDLFKNSSLKDKLEDVKREATTSDLKRSVDGALWQINSAFFIASSNQEDADGHVFISYSWKDKKAVQMVYKVIKKGKFKVWVDWESMTGSTLDAMGKAVQNAAAVVICISSSYQNSENCRTEAEYTYRLKKKCIPVLMVKGFQPSDWLGALVGTKLYFDFGNKLKLSESKKGLITELKRTDTTISKSDDRHERQQDRLKILCTSLTKDEVETLFYIKKLGTGDSKLDTKGTNGSAYDGTSPRSCESEAITSKDPKSTSKSQETGLSFLPKKLKDMNGQQLWQLIEMKEQYSATAYERTLRRHMELDMTDILKLHTVFEFLEAKANPS